MGMDDKAENEATDLQGKVKESAGKKVTLSGKMTGDTITVENVRM